MYSSRAAEKVETLSHRVSRWNAIYQYYQLGSSTKLLGDSIPSDSPTEQEVRSAITYLVRIKHARVLAGIRDGIAYNTIFYQLSPSYKTKLAQRIIEHVMRAFDE